MTRKFVRFSFGLGLLAAGWLAATPKPAHAAHGRDIASDSDQYDRIDRSAGKDPKPDNDPPKPTPRHGGDTPRPRPDPGPPR